MKIAVVHDYFIQRGGAEKLAEAIYNMFPGADLFATVALAHRMPDSLRHVSVKTSWMQRLPLMERCYRLYFPLYPLAVSSLDLSEYDLVISSSSGYVKGVRANADALHVCYCYTPMRWVWSFKSYSARESFGGTVRQILRVILHGLKAWDIGAARQPDHFITSSNVVAERIASAYHRHAEVIHPPINVERFAVSYEEGTHYIVLARLVSYKRIDLAVEAMTRLGRKLLVIGEGPAAESLKAIAGPSVRFVGRASDEDVEMYVRTCRALIFPGEEDFGLAPLEVAAAGRPTIALKCGGAVETVVDGQTGVFFDEPTSDALVEAVLRFERMQWDPAVIRRHAENFSVPIFELNMRRFLRRVGAVVDASLINAVS